MIQHNRHLGHGFVHIVHFLDVCNEDLEFPIANVCVNDLDLRIYMDQSLAQFALFVVPIMGL
jgi:hypothetical protein